MDAKKIGEFLKNLRKAKGLTQQAVADELYVNSKTISKWENGDSIPDISIILNVAAFYGVTVDEILKGSRNDTNLINKEEEDLKNERLISNVIRRKYNIYFYIALGVLMLFFITSIILYGYKKVTISMILNIVGILSSILILILGNQLCYQEADDYCDKLIERGQKRAQKKININNKFFFDLTFIIVVVFICLYIVFLEPTYITFVFSNSEYFTTLITFEMVFGIIIILGYYWCIRGCLFNKKMIEKNKKICIMLMIFSAVFFVVLLGRHVDVHYTGIVVAPTIKNYEIGLCIDMLLDYFPRLQFWMIILIEIMPIIGSIICIRKNKLIPAFINLIANFIITIIYNFAVVEDYYILSPMSIVILVFSFITFVLMVLLNNKKDNIDNAIKE